MSRLHRVNPLQRQSMMLVAILAAATGCAPLGQPSHFPTMIPPRTVRIGGGVVPPPDHPTHGSIDHARSPEHDLVQLWARESFYVGSWALHPYFLAYDRDTNRWERWEVWAGDLYGYYEETRKSSATFSDDRGKQPDVFVHRQVGAVRCWRPLFAFDTRGASLLHQWEGETATRLLTALRDPESYPARDHYLIWPGPNSNGYIRWILDRAGAATDLPPRMVGKDWHGLLSIGAGLTPTRTGLHLDVLSFGVAVGALDGVELHALGMTWGLDFWPPAFKTPFGRLGFAESAVRPDSR